MRTQKGWRRPGLNTSRHWGTSQGSPTRPAKQRYGRFWPRSTITSRSTTAIPAGLRRRSPASRRPARSSASLRDDPENSKDQNTLAAVLFNLGEIQRSDERLKDESLASYREASALWTTLARKHPSVAEYQENLGKNHGLLGYLHRLEGRYPEARDELTRCLEIREATFREHPTVASYKIGVAWTHYNLGIVARKLGRLPDSQSHLERAAELFGELVRDTPENLYNWNLLGNVFAALGQTLMDSGRDAQAVAACQRAIEHQRRAFDRNPTHGDYRNDLGWHYLGLAAVQRKLHRPAEAAESISQCLSLQTADARQLHDAARGLASCIPLVSFGSSAPTAAERLEYDRLADLAMVALRRSIAADPGGPGGMVRDPDLRALGSRSDFQQLVMDAAMPSNPFAQ